MLGSGNVCIAVRDLALEVGFSTFFADTLYRFASQHIHSYHYGVSQLLAESRPEDQIDLCAPGCTYSLMLISLTVLSFLKIYPEGRQLCPPPQKVQGYMNFMEDLHRVNLN